MLRVEPSKYQDVRGSPPCRVAETPPNNAANACTKGPANWRAFRSLELGKNAEWQQHEDIPRIQEKVPHVCTRTREERVAA
jgi:hypothetical protein